jgi:hypothetical protein
MTTGSCRRTTVRSRVACCATPTLRHGRPVAPDAAASGGNRAATVDGVVTRTTSFGVVSDVAQSPVRPILEPFARMRLAVAAAVVAIGCTQVLSADDYHVVGAPPGPDSGGGDSGAVECIPFPASRLVRLEPDGGLPPLPGPAPVDAGGAGAAAAVDAASPSDAASQDDEASDAAGPVPCSSLPNPVYATGSTAIAPFLGTIAQVVGRPDAQGRSVTVVYQGQGSCPGVDAILNDTPITQTATYWDPSVADVTQAALTCSLAPGGVVVDLGASDVFATTCFDLPDDLPLTVGDFFGPVQVMTFTVPQASTERVISAQAAYFVYGFGGAGMVSPWTDDALIQQRSASSGTQNMIAPAIGVPAALWHGETNAASQDVANALLAAGALGNPTASAAIGILGADIADGYRGQLKVLAFQAYGQTCGLYPDSTPTSEDKANVRTGGYPIWGPVHLLARLTSQGVPANADVGQIIDYLTGTAPLPGQGNLIQLYANDHLIPTCAMHVTRTTDGSGVSAYESAQPCSCYYDTLVSGTTSCAPCSSSSTCPAATPTCSYGYCEP